MFTDSHRRKIGTEKKRREAAAEATTIPARKQVSAKERKKVSGKQ
jgi:hypothetical protein